MFRHESQMALGALACAALACLGLAIVRGGEVTATGGIVLAVILTSVEGWTLRHDRKVAKKADADGWSVLVPVKASAFTRWVTLRSAGLEESRWDATEYHLRPAARAGAAVIRPLLRDLDRMNNSAHAPSLHFFAWRGVPIDEARRVLSRFTRDGDDVRLWRRWDYVYGVIRRASQGG